MNRQVLPSMLLSVFIVCFFAVVLRPVEPPGGRPPSPPQAPISPLEPIAEPPAVEAGAIPEPHASEAPAAQASPPAEVPAVAEVAPPAAPEPTAPVAEPPTVAAVPEPTPAPAAPEATAAPTVHVASRAVKPAPAPRLDVPREVRIASTPAPRRTPPAPSTPPPAPKIPAAAPPTQETPVATIPRGKSESTTALAGETLEDVAERVYGTRSAVATLRDANRGMIGRLRAGSLLWTPPR